MIIETLEVKEMVKKFIFAVDSHTAGEPARIIIGGIPKIPGKSMVEKKEYIKRNLDHIRTALMHEPRGHSDMFGAIITPPVSDEADFGVVFMDNSGFYDMCGHGSLAIVTVVVEMGMVDVVEPVTEVIFDTPAGLIRGYAEVENGRIKSVSVRNVPSFLYRSEIIKIPGIGEIPVDIAFGGNFFAIVNAEDLGVEVNTKNIPELLKYGGLIVNTVNEHIDVQHPEKTHITYVLGARIYDKPSSPEANVKNVVIFGKDPTWQVDRSPCGTGTCAHTAMLYAKGKVKLNEELIHESIIGTMFRAKAVEETKVGNYKAIIPEISCKAYITGFCTYVIDSEDPLKHGFLLKRT